MLMILLYTVVGAVIGLIFATTLNANADEEHDTELPLLTKLCFTAIFAAIGLVSRLLFFPVTFIILAIALIWVQLKSSHRLWSLPALAVTCGLFMSIAKVWDNGGSKPWMLILLAIPLSVPIIGFIKCMKLDREEEKEEEEKAKEVKSTKEPAKAKATKAEPAKVKPAKAAPARASKQKQKQKDAHVGFGIANAILIPVAAIAVIVAVLI